MSGYESIDGLRVTLDDAVLRLELDRPDKRNAIDDPMTLGLVGAIDTAGRDEDVRAIVLSGAGDHFCGGADIVARNARRDGERNARRDGERNARSADGEREARPRVGSIQRRVPSLAHRLIPLLLSTQTPVVCRVQGWAAGIGFQLAMASDFTIAADDATFWQPFAQRGFTPDSGATWMLPRLVGPARARELLLLGRKLSGSEAADWGVVHRAVPSDALDDEVAKIVEQLATGPTVALGLTKWLLNASPTASLAEQLQNEALGLELSSRSEDFREGLRAFKDKRPPDFSGR
jgi:2-(1,2-epoxy-1,2-dihydrophenyl)acetyl-CoA isomerase